MTAAGGRLGARLRALGGNGILRSMGGVGAAAVASQLLALAAAPLLTRLYDQESFGALSAFVSFSNIAATAILFGLNEAQIATPRDDTATAVFGAALWSALLLSPVAAVLGLWLVEIGWLGLDVLPRGLGWLLVPQILILALFSHLQGFVIRTRRFAAVGRSYVGLGAARAALQIAGGAAGAGPAGLAGGEMLGRGVAVAILAHALRVELVQALRVTPGTMARALRQVRHFPLYRTPSALATALATGLPTLVVADRYGAVPAGYFGLMLTVLVAPVALVQKAVGDVFLGHFAERLRGAPDAARRLLMRVLAVLAAGGAAFAGLLALFAPELFAILFGDRWRPAGVYAAAAAPWMGLSLVVLPISSALTAANRPGLKLIFDALYLGAIGAAWVIAARLQLAPVAFIALLAWLISAALAVYLAVIIHASRNPKAG